MNCGRRPRRPIPATIANSVNFLSLPNLIVEDYDPGPLLDQRAALDTLYIMRARAYDLSTLSINADGKPVMHRERLDFEHVELSTRSYK